MALNFLIIWIHGLVHSGLILEASIICVPVILIISLVTSTIAVILPILILLLVVLRRILKLLTLRTLITTGSLGGINLKSIIIRLWQILSLVSRVCFVLRWFRLIIRLCLVLLRIGRFLLCLVDNLRIFFALVCWLLLVKLLWGHTTKIIVRNWVKFCDCWGIVNTLIRLLLFKLQTPYLIFSYFSWGFGVLGFFTKPTSAN